MEDFDSKYKVQIYKEGSKWGGSFVLHGDKFYISGSTREGIVRQLNAQFGIKNEGYGRPKGTKNYRGRMFNEKDVKRLFNNVSAAVLGSALIARCATMDAMAEEFLKKVVSKARYDEYTGNLTSSFYATLVQKRRIVDVRLFGKNIDYSRISIKRTKAGSRYTIRRYSKFHSPAAIRKPNRKKIRNNRTKIYDLRDVRYLKPWEPDRFGYPPAFASKGMFMYPGKINRGDGRVQTGIIVGNNAPYASAVHRTTGRSVIDNSTAHKFANSGWGAQYEGIARVVSKSVLEKSFRRRFRNIK